MAILHKTISITTGCIMLPAIVWAQALIALVFGGKIKNDRIKLGIYLAASNSWLSQADGQQPRIGLALGAYTAYHLNDKSEICLYAVMKSPKGARSLPYSNAFSTPEDSSMIGADINRSITCMNFMPVYRYYLSKSLGIGAGPYLGIRINAKDVYKRSLDEGDQTYTVKTADYLKRFDLGATFDIQYTLMKGKGIRLNLQCNLGLLNVYKTGTADHRQLIAGVGIPIGKP